MKERKSINDNKEETFFFIVETVIMTFLQQYFYV